MPITDEKRFRGLSSFTARDVDQVEGHLDGEAAVISFQSGVSCEERDGVLRCGL